MKKNKMMRLASVLLVCVLLTTSVISGTFAKYVTTGSASDTARVAKFGVAITTSGTLYSDTYYAGSATEANIPAATIWALKPDYNNGTGISVNAETASENVVAPGTKSYGNGLGFGVTGTPEVAVEVKTSITAEDIFLSKAYTYGVMVPAKVNADNYETLVGGGKLYVKDATDAFTVATTGTYSSTAAYYLLTDEASIANDYFPVKYDLTGETTATDVTAQAVASKIADAVYGTTAPGAVTDSYLTKYTDISKKYNANTNLGTDVKLGSETLTWEWEFEATGMDAADTILGDMIAARSVATPNYYVVAINGSTVTTVTYGTGDDYTVKAGGTVVANLRTQFNIALTVTQVD